MLSSTDDVISTDDGISVFMLPTETSEKEISIDHDLKHLEEGVPKLCMSNLLISHRSIAFDSSIKSEPHRSHD